MHSLPKVNPPPHFTAEGILARARSADDGPPSNSAKAWAKESAAQKNSDALATYKLLVSAVKLIDKAHAWPTDLPPYRIDIVDGAEFATASDPGNIVDPDVSLYAGKNLHIRVGLKFLRSPAALHFHKGNIDAEQAYVFFLCHEIFHLSEIKRQRDCKFPANLARNGFAKSVRPEMNAEWVQVVRDLAAECRSRMLDQKRIASPPDPQVATVEALRAADTASEACADLQALAAHERIYGPKARLALQTVLLSQRISDETAGIGAYQIGQTMAAILSTIPTLTNNSIVLATWESARASIAAASDVSPALRAKVANCPMTFDRPLPELPTRKSLSTRAGRLMRR